VNASQDRAGTQDWPRCLVFSAESGLIASVALRDEINLMINKDKYGVRVDQARLNWLIYMEFTSQQGCAGPSRRIVKQDAKIKME
jgi:hypothetical protein